MPPTSIDGTDISSATIDGTEVQEITVDGDVVYQLSTIPDSAIHRFKFANNYDDSIGSMSISGNGTSFFSDSSYQGGYGLDMGGTGDGVNLSLISGEIGVNQAYTVAVTINLDNLGDGTIYEHQSGNYNRVILGVETNEIFHNQYDGSDFGVGMGTTESTTNRMRVAIVCNGTKGDIEIWKNGNDVSNTTTGDTNDSTLSDGHSLGYNAGQISGKSGDADDLIIYSDALTASEIQQDYDVQPWS